jgi:hypothetical protein
MLVKSDISIKSKVIKETSPDLMEKALDKLLNDGWVLAGPVQMVEGHTTWYYVATLTKEFK